MMRLRTFGIALLCALFLLPALSPAQARPDGAARCKPAEGYSCSSLDYTQDDCTVTFTGTFGGGAKIQSHARRGGPYTVFINILVDGVLYDSVPFDIDNFYGTFPQGGRPAPSFTFDEALTGNITAEFSGKPLAGYPYAVVDLPDDLGNCAQPLTDCPYPLPAGSVQARVVVSTPAYYAPSLESLIVGLTLPVGQSWWVIGAQDGFYHLFITCQVRYIWVPAESLGANFDLVWNGRALPPAGTPAQ